jgi:hypothetical protein
MLDLFKLAITNTGALDEAFAKLIREASAENAALIHEFASWIETEALISINVKLYVVGELLNGLSHMNTYAAAQEAANLTGQTADDILRQQLSAYYEKRIAFDHAFSDGEEFRYGALYVGGAGLFEYAPYCLVLTRLFQDSLTKAACLPGDSLKICFGDNSSFDEGLVKRFSAPFSSHRQVLVAIHRAPEIPRIQRDQWPQLVSGQGRYFEVVFIADVNLKSLAFVSVLMREYDRMLGLLLDSFGGGLEEGARANAHDFRVLLRGAKEGKVQLEVVK